MPNNGLAALAAGYAELQESVYVVWSPRPKTLFVLGLFFEIFDDR